MFYNVKSWCKNNFTNTNTLVLFFLLGNSPASGFYMPFQNTLFHLHRQVGVESYTYLPMKMEQTECSETSAYKIQTPGKYPEESIKHSEHGESLKSQILTNVLFLF